MTLSLNRLAFAVFLLLASATAALAQQPSPTPAQQQKGSLPPVTDKDVIKKLEKRPGDPYIETTFKNLSKMYWAVGAFDLENDSAIDNYLRINECPLYVKYFYNDFEWGNIRDATRKSLLKNMPSMPTRFEAVLPISLGQYDINKKQFEIKQESQQRALMRVEVLTNNYNEDICGNRLEVPGYPRNFVAVFNRPLTLVTVPVDPRVAELYINESRLRFQNLPTDLQLSSYERLAYLRLKMKMLQYKDTIVSRSGFKSAVIFVELEGWDVYSDAEQTQLLYTYKVPKATMLPRAALKAKPGEKAKEYNPFNVTIDPPPAQNSQ